MFGCPITVGHMTATPHPPSSPYATALLAAVDTAQAGDPLAPVTVLCPTPAFDDVVAAIATGGPRLGVDVVTLDMLLQRAARDQESRTLLQRADVAAFVARTLADGAEPTPFHEAKLHTSAATHAALIDALYTLLNSPAEWRANHGGAQLPSIVAEIAQRAVEEFRDSRFTFPDAVRAVAEDHRGALITVGALAHDARTEWALAQFPQATPVELPNLREHTERISLIAEPDEATYVTGRILDAVAAGTPLHAIAVAYCDDAELPFLTHALDEAGIPYHAPARDVWAQHNVFRALTALLTLRPAEMHRHQLVELLSTGKVADGLGLRAFDAGSRDRLGTALTGSDWDAVLDTAARQAEDGTPERERVPERSVTAARWVVDLRATLAPLTEAESWEGFASAFRAAALDVLALGKQQQSIYLDPLVDQLAAQQGAPQRERALEIARELAARPAHATNTGVLSVGPLESLDGRNLQLAFITGATDASLPGSLTPSATLTQAQQHTTPEQFLERRERTLSAALRASRSIVLTRARSGIAGGGLTEPSTWLEQEETRVGALYPGLTNGERTPTSQAELALANALTGHPSNRAARYAEIMRARHAGVAGEFTGYTGTDFGLHTLQKPISSSALEGFTKSPLEYFIQRVTGNWVLADDAAEMEVAASDTGTILHAVFERWTNEVWRDNPNRPEHYADLDWEGEAVEVMDHTLDRELAQHRTDQINPLVWDTFAEQARKDVHDWLAQERNEAEEGWTPLATEFAFGNTTEEPAASLLLPALGVELPVKGYADRVDYKVEDGTVILRVTDYKSGKGKTTSTYVEQKTPTGQVKDGAPHYYFQLALYGYIVRALAATGDPAVLFPGGPAEWPGEVTEVQARYWFFRDPDDSHVKITVDDDAVATLQTNLGNVYRHIQRGAFPPHAIPERWDSDERLRLGVSNYNALTAIMPPLDFEQPLTTEYTAPADA
ncbi:hypothetical protein CKJ81_11170 [Corynebacterium hadale]|uniref:PD-(D/E)XK endonuclease-like domain-containing protein n=2 Tax=Corynebacterium hadale TaxID=2026255 RepID=A0ABX4H701_9CORY|nr:hypothetical protein CKJ81_11170 [Corynebacterium hadale]